MNKDKIRGAIIGFILCAVLSASVMVLNAQTVTREITYEISVMLNGENVRFDYDSRPFVMGGRTFLPLRTIAELVDLPVDFDPSTNTAIMGERHPVGTRMSLNEVAPFFDSGGGRFAEVASVGTVAMGGRVYHNALTYGRSGANISPRGVLSPFSLHNLNGQFRMLTGYVGRVDETNIRDAIMTIYGDGQLLATYEIRGQDLPIPVSVFVEGINHLRIEFALDLDPGNRGVAGMTYAFVAFVE
ncbi:MAG: stalk domain-containing protein [Defluviitaleaceae bacterium]|nr:stalk domain-containing protein [Defluviitaleaceae bacterium]